MKRKKLLIFVICILLSCCADVFGQSHKGKLPVATIRDLDGKRVELSQYNSNENPVIVSFWATWCGPCIHELTAIHTVYKKWQEETGVELIAISIDDARTSKRVRPMVSGKGWDYKVLLDDNHQVKRAMNVVNVPYTFVLLKGQVVFEHSSYTPGAEEEMYAAIKKHLKN
ncbi:TlpA family protein disulfide reductase [Flavobacterium sp. JP2137]|uniref:TlpA family protein disulfide reductase n=1 Tax=Flavobacterium sp. JP2137 TaxID=3414510 RepID=UPI003D2FE3D8